jgi:hypothetical protein
MLKSCTGVLEFYDRETGEVLARWEDTNVILQQGIQGFLGNPGGTNWVPWNQWRIQIGTGYANPPEADWLSGLDHPIWTSGTDNTTYEREGKQVTVTAEIDPLEANGDLTEACLFSNKAFNRMMFKSPPLLPAGTYEYFVVNQIGQRFSPPSNIQSIPTAEVGALRLNWSQQYTGIVDKYWLFRRIVGVEDDYKLLVATPNTFFIDAGFAAASAVAPLSQDPAITAPSLAFPLFSPQIKNQPKARTKNQDVGARIKMTLGFS